MKLKTVMGIMLNTMVMTLSNRVQKNIHNIKEQHLIGTIQKEDEKDEDSLLEVVYG